MKKRKLTWKTLSWLNSSFLIATPLAALWGVWSVATSSSGVHWWMFALFFFMYIATGMAITAGYHRLFAHRTYQANPLVKLFLLLFGAAAFQNSAKKWSADHRVHHQHVDSEKDPYSIQEGFWYAHILWVFFKESAERKQVSTPDLDKDPLVVWQDKHYLILSALMGFVLPAWIGSLFGSAFAGFIFGGLLRVVVVHHCTFLINSLCHLWGRQTYTDENSAKDNYFLAFLTYGEGYHNFHHKFQGDYRNGLKWYHFDPTKWFIRCLSFAGFANKLKRVPDEEIFKAKLKMQQKNMIAKGEAAHLETYIEDLRQKVELAQRRWKKICHEYETLKRNLPAQGKERLAQLQFEMQLAHIEFKKTYSQWKLHLNRRLLPST